MSKCSKSKKIFEFTTKFTSGNATKPFDDEIEEFSDEDVNFMSSFINWGDGWW